MDCFACLPARQAKNVRNDKQKDTMKRRVVITGAGVISPIGNSLEAFTESLQKGRSGLAAITSFDVSKFPVKQACEVKNFDSQAKGLKALDPFIQYAVTATQQALDQAKFNPAQVDPYRVGISVSSSKGGMHTLDRFKTRFEKNPSAILGARIYSNSVPNFAAQWIARRWKIQGPARCYVAACATGTTAVIEGTRMVAESEVDYCLAGASDASVVPLMLAGYRNMKALAKEKIRPFDKRRDGFVVGEGSGIVFLETLESAKARGVPILGEVTGFQYGHDATHAIHYSENENALARALKPYSPNAQEIGYINLHGTGTPGGDIYETSQIKKAFGKIAYDIPMSSTKSMTGHMLGASGAVEVIACLQAMREAFIPPTIELERPDPACDLNYTPLKSVQAGPQTAVSISMGFGGHIAIIQLKKT